MAIYRNIHMSFWTDTKISDDYSPDDKYFYLYLMTNPHTNLCGCYEISINQMAAELGHKPEMVKKLIAKAVTKFRVVVYDENTREILLLNWHKYNWTGSEKFKKALVREIKNIKCPRFREYLEEVLNSDDTVSFHERYGIETVSNESKYPMDTINVSVSVTDTVTVPIKHKYGEYKNVLMTDAEIEKLKNEFPQDWQKRIEELSGYMKSKGVKYKDHLATIRNWARKEKKGTNYDERQVDYDSMIAGGWR